MVELHIQSGPDAGKILRPPSLPFTVGRAPANGVCLSGPGIWDRHAEVTRGQDGRCHLRVLGEALATHSDKPCEEWGLRNGESFMLGGVRLCFVVGSVPQRSLKAWEWAGWLGVAVVVAVEGWLAFSG